MNTKEITMKNVTLKNIAISSILAATTCFAMVGQASAATDKSPAHATQMQHHKGDMNKDKNPLSKLNLTAKQQAQIRDIRQDHRDDGKKGHEQAKKEISKVLTPQQRNQLEKM